MTDLVEYANIRTAFGAARNQGSRPTCLAFAVSDAHAAVRDATPLSCEYLFYKAQTRASRPFSKGALLGATLASLREDGQPEEGGWPYSRKPPADEASWVPPADVGVCYGRDGWAHMPAFDDIVTEVEAGNPYVLLLRMTDSFYYPAPGGIVCPVAGEIADPIVGHAVIAAGHGSEGGSRYLLIRNSWGEKWGVAGYGWVPESYIRQWLYGAARMGDEIDVPASQLAA